MHIVNKACLQNNIQSYIIHKNNLEETKNKLHSEAIKFNTFLDRASDEDHDFTPFIESVKEKCNDCWFLNDSDHGTKISDKSIMHFELAHAGINVPLTIILPSLQEKPEIDLSAIERLGTPFIIKPAKTSGGGIGVIKNAKTEKDVEQARKSNPTFSYLLQEHITPTSLNEKRAWFRGYYVLGEILLCWWDDQTHLYNTLSKEDEDRFHLHELRTITQKIGMISRLDFFSTEIALDRAGRFIVIDYINDICDMRLKSRHYDGVPDDIVHEIAGLIVRGVKNKICTGKQITETDTVFVTPTSKAAVEAADTVGVADTKHPHPSFSRFMRRVCNYKKQIFGRLTSLFRRSPPGHSS
ncbi:MAG: ATP-grasp domain-containing protein [bacterium]